MERAAFERWIAAYERAWRTPGTDVLADLFAPDATYSTAPYEQPYRDLEAIAEFWERQREGPDEQFTMTSELVAAEGDTAVARVEVHYTGTRPSEYRDLWVIRLDRDARCTHFEEWPFAPPGQSGPGWAAGPSGSSG
jgi:ketosteroid isomerase-like protein